MLPIVIFAAAHTLMLVRPAVFWNLTAKARWFGPLTPRSAVETAGVLADDERARKHAWRYQHCLGPNHVAKIAVEAATAVIALQIAWHAKRRGRRALAVIYLVVGVGAAVIAADEARWGETFGLQLFPDSWTVQVKETNLQAELTLHNQPRVQNWIKLGMTVLALYGLISSLWVASRRREWFQEKALYAFIPHPVLTPGFVVVLFHALERVAYKWITGNRVPPLWSRLQEPTELVAVLTLLIFCWLALRTVKRWPRVAHAP
ncbi:MAG: hypothetical protein N2689_08050 [Verrucomicrobiae bacterium]|nr:hypothetical protein [Verrucomicrobiae bacterium]